MVDFFTGEKRQKNLASTVRRRYRLPAGVPRKLRLSVVKTFVTHAHTSPPRRPEYDSQKNERTKTKISFKTLQLYIYIHVTGQDHFLYYILFILEQK